MKLLDHGYKTMGRDIEPNLNCPEPEIGISEFDDSKEACWAYTDINCPTMEPTYSCLEGLGHCYYEYFAGSCEPVGGDWYKVLCFFTYVDDDCEIPGGYEPHHKNDIPRTLLFDYGMNSIAGTKYELYGIDDCQKKVIAFRNPKASMNVKIKHNPACWLNYDVAGELDPDAAGNYTSESESPFDPLNKLPESDKRPTYVSSDRKFFLWWDGVNTWFLSDLVGCLDNPYWSRVDPVIRGAYNPQNGAVGVATVSLGEL